MDGSAARPNHAVAGARGGADCADGRLRRDGASIRRHGTAPASGILAPLTRSCRRGRFISSRSASTPSTTRMQVRAYVSPGVSESKNARSRLRPRFDLVGQPRQHGGGNQAGGGRPYRQLDFRGRLERGQRHPLPVRTPMWPGSASSSWTASPHSGSRPGSRCGRGRSGTICIRQAGPDPIRMTFS